MIKKLSFITIAIGLTMVLVAFVPRKAEKSDFEAAKDVIVMRNIAHQILRYSGDSTSPVAPVIRVSATEFKIPFERSFSFEPDSLISIIDKVVAMNQLPSKYIVNVLERKTDKVIYGYAVLGPEQKSIVPCGGRNQPAKPYDIDIKFQESKGNPSLSLCAGGSSLLGIGLLLFFMSGYKKREPITEPQEKQEVEKQEEALPLEHQEEEQEKQDDAPVEKSSISIGRYVFFVEEQLLKFNEEETPLTVKEAKILSIFANAQNQIIDRQRLQKEIWEDEGVIVGRSLDMFISRLRKKLENDEAVKIVNIHSKGYKLEINSNG